MENCIFCKIIKGEIPTNIIWQDDKAIAFPTIRPFKKGHILLIPKNHTDYFFDLPDEDLKELTLKAKPLAAAMKKVFKPGSGKISMVLMGMGVHHVHLHLMPLDRETDINTDNVYDASSEELNEVTEKIKTALEV